MTNECGVVEEKCGEGVCGQEEYCEVCGGDCVEVKCVAENCVEVRRVENRDVCV